jgi:hypothetical protein
MVSPCIHSFVYEFEWLHFSNPIPHLFKEFWVHLNQVQNLFCGSYISLSIGMQWVSVNSDYSTNKDISTEKPQVPVSSPISYLHSLSCPEITYIKYSGDTVIIDTWNSRVETGVDIVSEREREGVSLSRVLSNVSASASACPPAWQSHVWAVKI